MALLPDAHDCAGDGLAGLIDDAQREVALAQLLDAGGGGCAPRRRRIAAGVGGLRAKSRGGGGERDGGDEQEMFHGSGSKRGSTCTVTF